MYLSKLLFLITLLSTLHFSSGAQLRWTNVDSLYQPLPANVHIYKTTDPLDGQANTAYYVSALLKDRRIDFTADTTLNRRLTPSGFYEKNNKPVVVVNCTFFSFETNRSLNTVVKDRKLVGFNIHSIKGKGKDSAGYRHPLGSAIGISKKRKADVAWLYTDSTLKYPVAFENHPVLVTDKNPAVSLLSFTGKDTNPARVPEEKTPFIKKWKMQTAVGGGPVLLQNGEVKITNNEELKFSGKAINDRHPRTAIGYTKEGELIILVVQGRSESGSGATLVQEANILKDLGCYEALNLDGGGSSCMLVNGKETIKPSDKEGQRPVPAVLIIK